jgi:excisionase family DNA binding protein
MTATHPEQKPTKQKKPRKHPAKDTPPAVRGTQAQRARKEQRKRTPEEAVPALRGALTGGTDTFHVTVAEAGKVTLEVPREAMAILVETMAHIASGRMVKIIAEGMELSTIQAAKVLNVSRPHLVSLLDKGAIEYRMVGTHRRVDAASLEDYQRRTQREQVQRRRAAVASAIGSTHAEGLRVDADTTTDLDAFTRGDLDAETLRARALARYTRAAAE